MKIFSWVHRKLNQKDGLFDRNVTKNEMIISTDENIGDKHFLFQDDSMEHLLGDWKRGILTIGTFGFDPLVKDQLTTGLDEDHEAFEIITVSHDDDDELDQQNPLIYANNGDDQVISHDEAPPLMESVMITGSKKERITLADLFSADQLSDKEKVQLPDLYDDVTNINNKKMKNGVSFAKKIIPRVRKDSRRILQLQKLMTRALRKKVHPDMESKNNKNTRVIAEPETATTMLELSSIPSASISLREILETSA